MGLFDSINNAINRYGSRSDDVADECEYLSPHSICDKMRNASHDVTRLADMGGYIKALKRKAQDMSDYELQSLYKEVYAEKNAAAAQALKEILQDRGY